MVDEKILKDIEEAKILSIFKNIYNDYSNYKEKTHYEICYQYRQIN